jgi:hypothetical protein
LLQKNLCEIYGQLILFFTIFDLKTSGLLKMTEYALSANWVSLKTRRDQEKRLGFDIRIQCSQVPT